ncbi:protein of unknown function [Magnetospirillum sp. XM-1]|nr:protein of unknown function [Magnetospirillum sp. XM-1]
MPAKVWEPVGWRELWRAVIPTTIGRRDLILLHGVRVDSGGDPSASLGITWQMEDAIDPCMRLAYAIFMGVVRNGESKSDG